MDAPASHEKSLDDVAIVLVPRERLRATGAALDRLRALTATNAGRDGAGERPPRIVAVDIAGAGGVSRAARDDPRVAIVTTPSFVMPYEARNLAHAHAHARGAAFVVFVDTDAIPAPGCIEALVRAARETGAACVHPLVVVRQAERERVHAARCILAPTRGATGTATGTVIEAVWPRIEGMGLDAATFPAARAWDDYGELHLALFSRAALDVVAPFPALSLAEDIAIACKLRDAGLRSLLEPAARATYAADAVDDDVDRAYFRHRWDARTARATIEALRALPIDAGYWLDKERWLVRHRRLARPLFGAALAIAARVRRQTSALVGRGGQGRPPHPSTLKPPRDKPWGSPQDLIRERDVVIVIPARAAASFVGEAIASARAQEHVAGVAVVIDDAGNTASATATAAQARAAGADVVIELPAPAGAAAARNAGVRAMEREVTGNVTGNQARFFVFLDADDRLRPNAIARLRALVIDEGAVLAYGEASPIEADGAAIGPDRTPWFAARPQGDVRRAFLAANPIATTGAALVARDAFVRAGGFPEHLLRAHDWALWCRIAALGAFAYARDVVVERRWHPASISSTIGLSMEASLRAVDFVFADAMSTRDLDRDELASLRAAQEASAYALAATERLKLDDVNAARELLMHALRRRPRARELALLVFATAFTTLPPGLATRVPHAVRARLR